MKLTVVFTLVTLALCCYSASAIVGTDGTLLPGVVTTLVPAHESNLVSDVVTTLVSATVSDLVPDVVTTLGPTVVSELVPTLRPDLVSVPVKILKDLLEGMRGFVKKLTPKALSALKKLQGILMIQQKHPWRKPGKHHG